MPIVVREHAARNRILLSGSGVIDIFEMRAAVDQFRAGAGRVVPILLDLSEATLTFSSEDVAKLAEDRAAESKQSRLGPLALVAKADAPYGVSRMFKAYSDANGRPHVGVFRDAVSAERWFQSLE